MSKTSLEAWFIKQPTKVGKIGAGKAQRRWFKVDDVNEKLGTIKYYDSEGCKKLKGTIALAEISHSVAIGAKLDIVTPNRVYKLEAVLKADADRWNKALSARRVALAPALSPDAAEWTANSESTACMQCAEPFSLLKRRHHCRFCGELLCATCAPVRKGMALKKKGGIRMCTDCHAELSGDPPDFLLSQPGSLGTRADDGSLMTSRRRSSTERLNSAGGPPRHDSLSQLAESFGDLKTLNKPELLQYLILTKKPHNADDDVEVLRAIAMGTGSQRPISTVNEDVDEYGDGDEGLYDAATLQPPVPKPFAASGRAQSQSVSAKVNPFGSSPPAAKPKAAGSGAIAEDFGADENRDRHRDGPLYDVAGVGSVSNPFSAAAGNTPAVVTGSAAPRKGSNPFAPEVAALDGGGQDQDDPLYDVAGVGSVSNPFSAAGGNVPAAASPTNKTAQRQEPNPFAIPVPAKSVPKLQSNNPFGGAEAATSETVTYTQPTFGNTPTFTPVPPAKAAPAVEYTKLTFDAEDQARAAAQADKEARQAASDAEAAERTAKKSEAAAADVRAAKEAAAKQVARLAEADAKEKLRLAKERAGAAAEKAAAVEAEDKRRKAAAAKAAAARISAGHAAAEKAAAVEVEDTRRKAAAVRAAAARITAAAQATHASNNAANDPETAKNNIATTGLAKKKSPPPKVAAKSGRTEPSATPSWVKKRSSVDEDIVAGGSIEAKLAASRAKAAAMSVSIPVRTTTWSVPSASKAKAGAGLATSAPIAAGGFNMPAKKLTGRKGVAMAWCQGLAEGSGVEITNFGKSFGDGRAFCAIMWGLFPDKIPIKDLDPKNRAFNFELAFSVAEEKGQERFLDVEDCVEVPYPDSLSVMTYVFELQRRFKNVKKA